MLPCFYEGSKEGIMPTTPDVNSYCMWLTMHRDINSNALLLIIFIETACVNLREVMF